MSARMTDQEVKAFLDTKPGWIVLSTLGRDGYPHSVPLGYFRLGDDVYIGCAGRGFGHAGSYAIGATKTAA